MAKIWLPGDMPAVAAEIYRSNYEAAAKWMCTLLRELGVPEDMLKDGEDIEPAYEAGMAAIQRIRRTTALE